MSKELSVYELKMDNFVSLLCPYVQQCLILDDVQFWIQLPFLPECIDIQYVILYDPNFDVDDIQHPFILCSIGAAASNTPVSDSEKLLCYPVKPLLSCTYGLFNCHFKVASYHFHLVDESYFLK
jgi:hypothetical protein